MQSRAAIASDYAAYRRGVVLGLTMAEIMLLLVFCLLIAASVIFARDRDQNADLQTRVASLDDKLSTLSKERDKLNELVKLMKANNHAPQIGDDWEKLMSAVDFADEIDKAGLSREQIVAKATDLSALLRALAVGTTAEDLLSALANEQELSNEVAAKDMAGLSVSELVRLAKAAHEAEKKGTGEHDWPPIIPLSEADGYSFAAGRAELTADFESRKAKLVDQVADLIVKYKVDVVEVVGHTDEQRMPIKTSNLDTTLIGALGGEIPIAELTPSDNAGLGMARAVSVASVLRSDPRLRGVTIIPYSAAQLLLPGDKLADGTSTGDVKERRRIEIRMRRSGQVGQ